jgi:competence protein ComEA
MGSIPEEKLMRRLVRLQQPMAAILAIVVLALSGLSTPAAEAEAPVNINTAGVEELISLPRIGPSIAQRIIDYREANGPFKRSAELMNVKGIGEKTFLDLKDRITTGAKGDR